MYTVCPKCALTLVVTAADLRVAQGYVRCGRCSSVFNALAQLSDERAAARGAESPPAAPEPEPVPEPAAEAQPPAAQSPPPAAGAQAPSDPAAASRREEVIPEDALEFNPSRTDASSVFVAAPPNPQWTAATGSFKSLVAANQEGAATPPKPEDASGDLNIELDAALLSDIVENAPRPPAAPAPLPKPRDPAPAATQPPAEPTAATQPAATQPAAAAPEPRRGGLKPAVAAAAAAAMRELDTGVADPANLARQAENRARETEPPAQVGGEDSLPPDSFEPLSRPATRPEVRLSPQVWYIGALVLVVLLVAQLINHQRDALATDPRFGRPLTALYASLGVTLMPNWDLHAYDVRQLGATVAPAPAAGATGTITVRASIRNAGAKPQPLPLLRVTLQDRFGNRIASRDVQPGDYLPRSIPASALLSVDQRIDAELAFVDPGSNAVGFELDACLPVRGGVACANDASAIK